MKYIETSIPDVKVIEPEVFGDDRGFFKETFRQSWFDEQGISFVQDNHSKSAKGTLRGLHYQTIQPQGKLVHVIAGVVFDVAVDMRQSSAFFGQWVGQELSSDNHLMMWVPPGFAHGFVVLSETAEFVYRCTDYYAPEHERTLRWNDETLKIDWHYDGAPRLSDKDALGASFIDTESYQ